jgi:hypothetical protein
VANGLLLLVAVSLVWQASRLRGWATRFRYGAQRQRAVAWIAIGLDILLAASILALPNLLGSRWHIVLYHRPDTTLPLLAAGLLLAVMALIKAALSVQTVQTKETPE